MDLEQINKQISELKKERKILLKQSDKIEKSVLKNYNKLKKLYEKRDKIKFSKECKEFDIDLILTAEHESMIAYLKAQEQIEKLGLYRMGYYSNTYQAALKLMLYRNDEESLKKTIYAVNFLLPHILPFNKSKDTNDIFVGKKIFGIFEETLSEQGAYNFAVLKDNSCELIITRYSRTKILKSFPTIEEGIEYIWMHHPYGEKE